MRELRGARLQPHWRSQTRQNQICPVFSGCTQRTQPRCHEELIVASLPQFTRLPNFTSRKIPRLCRISWRSQGGNRIPRGKPRYSLPSSLNGGPSNPTKKGPPHTGEPLNFIENTCERQYLFSLEKPDSGWHGQTRLPVGSRLKDRHRMSTVKQVWRCHPADRDVPFTCLATRRAERPRAARQAARRAPGPLRRRRRQPPIRPCLPPFASPRPFAGVPL